MKHHTSMRVMLAHWHHLTKGIRPFGHTFDAKGKEQLARLADLSELEVDFVTHTNALMQETYRREYPPLHTYNTSSGCPFQYIIGLSNITNINKVWRRCTC